jgi:hypothetical protein
MDATAIQTIVSGANTRITWSLSIIAGSLGALLSTSYVRPMGKWSKLIYLIFIPGWIYLANTIYWGDSIARRGIAAALYPERIPTIVSIMNIEFANQLDNFNTALIFFIIWLFLYLIWSSLIDFLTKTKNL